jgi:catecholate siderophore receptor
MNDFRKSRRTPIAAAVFAALNAAPLFAQGAGTQEEPAQRQLPPISVSAEGDDELSSYKPSRASSPKFTEPLLDTPQTVLVIKKQVMMEQGATSLTDALRNVPGITFQLGENGNTQSGDTIFMRGFDSQNSIFLDGIRDLGAAVRDIFNVEQVEIFKGPAGADNGRGATSGYVNLASKVPLASDAFSSTVAYGTQDRGRFTADWNTAIESFEGAAFRLNVMGQQGGIAGRDFIERDSWGVAPSFALGLGTATRFFAYSQHIRQDNIPDGAVSAIGVADHAIPLLLDNGITPAPVDEENYYGLTTDFEDIRADMFTARIEHDFSDNVVLRNTSRYGRSEQERILTAPNQAPIVFDGPATAPVLRTDPATWTLARTSHASFRDNEILTNQTNLTARFRSGSWQHSVTSGLEFIYESQFTPTITGLGTLEPTNLYNPDRTGVYTTAPNPARSGAFSDGETITSALYAFDTIELNDRWHVTGGLRIEHFRTETQSVAISTATPPVTTTAALDDSDTLASWKVGVLYKPLTNGSVYVSFANSLKPPGADNFTLNATASNINSPNLDPQKASNIELGTKWEFLDGELALTGALFHSQNENDLARTDPGNPDAVIQYGEKEVKGLEIGLVGRITPAWQLSFGLTSQDTEVTDGSIPAAGGPSTQTGAAINFSPKLSATLWTTYALPRGFTIGGGARHVDTQARQINNAPTAGGVFEVPSFTVVDLFAYYAVTDNIGMQLNAYNVLDEEYISAINNSGQRYIAGIPRSYLFTVNFAF